MTSHGTQLCRDTEVENPNIFYSAVQFFFTSSPYILFWLTAAFKSQEARQFVLAALLLVIGQQLVNKLPDQLFGWSVQHWEHVHNEGVHVSANTERDNSIHKFSIHRFTFPKSSRPEERPDHGGRMTLLLFPPGLLLLLIHRSSALSQSFLYI